MAPTADVPDPPAPSAEVLIKRHKKSDVGFLNSIKLSSFVKPSRLAGVVVVAAGGLIIFIIFPFSSLFSVAVAVAVLGCPVKWPLCRRGNSSLNLIN